MASLRAAKALLPKWEGGGAAGPVECLEQLSSPVLSLWMVTANGAWISFTLLVCFLLRGYMRLHFPLLILTRSNTLLRYCDAVLEYNI